MNHLFSGKFCFIYASFISLKIVVEIGIFAEANGGKFESDSYRISHMFDVSSCLLFSNIKDANLNSLESPAVTSAQLELGFIIIAIANSFVPTKKKAWKITNNQ